MHYPSLRNIDDILQLMVLYGNTSTTPELSWVLPSLGIRMAQSVAAHRRKPDKSKWTVGGRRVEKSILGHLFGRCDELRYNRKTTCDDIRRVSIQRNISGVS